MTKWTRRFIDYMKQPPRFNLEVAAVVEVLPRALNERNRE